MFRLTLLSSLLSPIPSLTPPPSPSFITPPPPSPSPSPPPLYSNPDIHLLPLTLGRLRNCWELILHGLKISNVPQHLMPGVTRGGSTKHLLAYLRAQLRNCVPYNRMKLMLVGLQVRGSGARGSGARGSGVRERGGRERRGGGGGGEVGGEGRRRVARKGGERREEGRWRGGREVRRWGGGRW